MLQLEKFVTEGNEKGDELAEAGAMLDQGFMAEARAKIVQQEREKKKKCTQLCSMLPAFTAWLRNGKIAKCSSQSQRKNGFSWKSKGRKRSVERSGVLRPTSIDV